MFPLPSLRAFLLAGCVAAGLSGCHRASDDVDPISVQGEWRLAVSGGGITGVMSPMPAGRNIRLVLGPDSAYAQYFNGQLQEASIYHLRTLPPRSPGAPAEQVLLLKTTNTPTGQPIYRTEYVTLLTATDLHLSTGGGCAINGEYVRVGAAPKPRQ